MGDQVVAQAQRVLEEASSIKQIALQGKDQLAAPLRIIAVRTSGRLANIRSTR